MNLAIRKSLFNKEVDSININPEILVNGDNKHIKNSIIDLIDESDRIDISVSYIVWSGLSLIYDSLMKKDVNSRVLVTTDGLVTSPQALRRLLKLDLTVKVYSHYNNTNGFHMKTYQFYKEESRTLMIGSSNISNRAFGETHEMMIRVDSNENGELVDQYNQVFYDVWNDKKSVLLTEEFIRKYELDYYLKKRLDKKRHDDYLKSSDIKPNYMQEMALEQLNNCRESFNKGIVIAATGTGKTYLSAFDVKQFRARKVLFLVHNRTILRSAIKTFKNVFKDKRILELSSKNINIIDKYDFIFTTNKTAVGHLIDKVSVRYFDYIIYDEAHKIGFDTQYDRIMDYFNPEFSLGMTATPERTDDADYLFERFEYSVPYEIRLIDALNHSLICPFSYYGVDVDVDGYIEKGNEDLSELAEFVMMQILKFGHSGSKLKGIVFCSKIKEAKLMSQEFNKLGVPSTAIVSGKNGINEDEIQLVIEEFQSDDKSNDNLLCVVDKFNEGVDIPEINTIVMLRNTSSSIIFLQQLGRGLRLTSDNDKFVTVIDLIGNSNNNYTIAEALTGRQTVDQEKLISHAIDEFESISPYINVSIEEVALNKIIKSISHTFKAKRLILKKFKDELTRYRLIPDLVDLYRNPVFNEMELLQLLNKEYYSAFEEYYIRKYDVEPKSKFIRDLLSIIMQFTFRYYTREQLVEYVRILDGYEVRNESLAKMICPYDLEDGSISTFYYEYRKHSKHLPPFIYRNGTISFNTAVLDELVNLRAHDLFREHVELIRELISKKDYLMKPFSLVTKVEFLSNLGFNNLSLMTGQAIQGKKVFCPIVIKKDIHVFENKLLDQNHILYQTQGRPTKEKAMQTLSKLKDYDFEFAVKLPHLKYESTSYFYLGKVKMLKLGDEYSSINNDGTLTKYTNGECVRYTDSNGKIKYNNTLIFELKNDIPVHLLLYKDQL